MSNPDNTTVAVVAILALLLLIVSFIFALTKQLIPLFAELQFRKSIAEQVKELAQSVQHYVEVNAVLAQTESFIANPELLKQLPEHGREVYAAALMQRLNSRASQLANNERLLATAYEDLARDAVYANKVKRLEGVEKTLLGEVEAANAALQLFENNGLQAV